MNEQDGIQKHLGEIRELIARHKLVEDRKSVV
jgi:hypothetical protein